MDRAKIENLQLQVLEEDDFEQEGFDALI